MHGLPDEELHIWGPSPSNPMHGLPELRSPGRTTVDAPQPQKYSPTQVHHIPATTRQELRRWHPYFTRANNVNKAYALKWIGLLRYDQQNPTPRTVMEKCKSSF